MATSSRVLSVRAVGLVLIGLAWLCTGVNRAEAGGCHTSERPALGLVLPWEQPASIDVETTEARINHQPCSQDLPGQSRPELPPTSPASLLPAWKLPPDVRCRWEEPRERLHALHVAATLDRPPRSSD